MMAAPVEVQLEGDATSTSVVSIRIDDDGGGVLESESDGRGGEICHEEKLHALSFPVEESARSSSSPQPPTTHAVVALAHRAGGELGLLLADDESSRLYAVNTHNSILDITLDEDDPQQSDDHDSTPSSAASTPTPASPRPSCPLTPPSYFRGDKSSCCHSGDLLLGAGTPANASTGSGAGIGEVTHKGSALLDLTERFVGLCFGDRGHLETPRSHHQQQHPPPPPPYPGGSSVGGGSSRHGKGASSPRGGSSGNGALSDAWCRGVHDDLFQLLGCADAPDADEVEHLWTDRALFCLSPESPARAALRDGVSTPTAASARSRPRRLSRRRRDLRLHRLRAERRLPKRRTGLSSSIAHPPAASSFPLLPHRGRSFDLRMLLGGRSASVDDDNDDVAGYDSDPGEVLGNAAPPMPILPQAATRVSVEDDEDDFDGSDGESLDQRGCYAETARLQQVVQESLNLQWTLTWHLPVDPRHPHYGASGGGDRIATAAGKTTTPTPRRPSTMCIQAWLERGTLVHNTTLLEPNLMWREAYQPHLHRNRRLNPSTRAPYALKLLNVCRIVDVVRDDDASTAKLYPLARPSCCFSIRTVESGDYLMEASSPREKRDVVRRWKCVVARFAALAVLEQLDALVEEFFARGVAPALLAAGAAAATTTDDGEEDGS